MKDARKEEDLKRMREAVLCLCEHFDTVQIFVTRHEAGTDDGGTGHCELGVGNWYAREGQVREWLALQDEIARDSVREKPL